LVSGRNHSEFHDDVSGPCEIDQLGAEFVVGEVEHRRDVSAGGIGNSEFNEGSDLVAAGDGVDERGNLHAMREAQVDDVDDGEALGGC